MVLDSFEVVMLLGACFLLNYITADSKTNWVEGYTLISFYAIIVSVPRSIEAIILTTPKSAYSLLATF